jgi:hypothetical protein
MAAVIMHSKANFAYTRVDTAKRALSITLRPAGRPSPPETPEGRTRVSDGIVAQFPAELAQ